MSILFMGSLQLGLLYAMMAMGVYISFRILNTPDLTVDGSFTLGMAVSVVFATKGYPVLGLILAVLAGALAGLVTGFLQTKIKINPILAGILTMTGLYSVNLHIMGGKANISLFTSKNVFSSLENFTGFSQNTVRFIIISIFVLCLFVVLCIFFKTRIGMAIRATGDNEEMVRSSSINANLCKCIGFAVGNACVALAGGLICQYQKSADISFGSGMVVVGLASVIIGEAVLGRRNVTIGLLSVLCGATAYQVIIALALKVELFPAYGLKLVSALIVAIALSIPSVRESAKKLLRRSA